MPSKPEITRQETVGSNPTGPALPFGVTLRAPPLINGGEGSVSVLEVRIITHPIRNKGVRR